MSDMTSLTHLFTNNTISLSGRGRTPVHGTAYTTRELHVATTICRLVLTIMKIECSQPFTNDEIQQSADIISAFETANEVNKQFNDVAHAIRATYSLYEQYQLANPDTLEAFPKLDPMGERTRRNQSSIHVLFRKVIKPLVTKQIRDQIFKPMTPGKKND